MQELDMSPGQPDPDAAVVKIAFLTSDVAGVLERARSAGANIHQDMRQESWCQTTACVASPDGYLIELCTPIGNPDWNEADAKPDDRSALRERMRRAHAPVSVIAAREVAHPRQTLVRRDLLSARP